MAGKRIAIIGATGLVGRTMLRVIEEWKWQQHEYTLLASARSAGSELSLFGRPFRVGLLTEESIARGYDLALFSAGSEVSRHYAPIAARCGTVVIDNSACWRMEPSVPLVVPQVNPGDASRHCGIIANPNCSTIQAVVALWPLHREYGIRRIVYATYQSVSGTGIEGIRDLDRGIQDDRHRTVSPRRKFDRRIFSNCIPFIGCCLDDGSSGEEDKMIRETRRLLHDGSLAVTATCVRVPVRVGHCEAINVELCRPFALPDIVRLLESTPGLIVMNDSKNAVYPTVIDCEGRDEVFVGRIRRDDSAENALNMWVTADNLRKGAAVNALEIAKLLIEGE